ncbi:MAG: glycosyltransferase [Nocardioides sp.]
MIGYYVHHQGRGHETRMRCIAEHLGEPVTVLSSLPPGKNEHIPWVELPRDDEMPGPEDVTAHGRLHWVPRHDPGLALRSARIAAWITTTRPALVVVDVSVEVAVLSRVCGIPVVVVGMPGRRDDPAHALGYDLAEAILAPWPAGHQTGWPDSWNKKTVFLGAVSRFDGWTVPAPAEPGHRGPRGLLLWGAGGEATGAQVLASLRTGAPDWHWDVAGLEGRLLGPEQTWRAMAAADVVVTHAGQGSVAEVAAARRPAVVIADDRPFDEQRCTVRRLERARLAATAVGCPPPDECGRLLAEALALDPRRWSSWNPGDGASRAARHLERLARPRPPTGQA